MTNTTNKLGLGEFFQQALPLPLSRESRNRSIFHGAWKMVEFHNQRVVFQPTIGTDEALLQPADKGLTLGLPDGRTCLGNADYHFSSWANVLLPVERTHYCRVGVFPLLHTRSRTSQAPTLTPNSMRTKLPWTPYRHVDFFIMPRTKSPLATFLGVWAISSS